MQWYASGWPNRISDIIKTIPFHKSSSKVCYIWNLFNVASKSCNHESIRIANTLYDTPPKTTGLRIKKDASSVHDASIDGGSALTEGAHWDDARYILQRVTPNNSTTCWKTYFCLLILNSGRSWCLNRNQFPYK